MANAKFFSFLIFISVLCSTHLALAYIPPYWMIMSRTSENHGKGAYRVTQDIIFSHLDPSTSVQESWLVVDDETFRVEVSGRGALKDKIKLTYIYSNGHRYFVDESGVKKMTKISPDFFEHIFHYRLSKTFKPYLVNQHIAPAASLESKPHRHSESRPWPAPEPYIRLSRVGGAVAYAIGEPTPTQSSNKYPGLWIEQDQFVILKIRLPSNLEIRAKDYTSFGRGLKLPKEREVLWGEHSAKVLLKSATAFNLGPKTKEVLNPSSLNFGQNPEISRVLPEDEVIKDFYQRMR